MDKRTLLQRYMGNNSTVKVLITREEGLKIIAFKKIYYALYGAQENTIFKSNFLAARNTDSLSDLYQAITTHAKKINSRTHKAWGLACKFYETCSTDNFELFVEIYLYAWKKTRFNFFAQKIVFNEENFAAQKKEHWNDSLVKAITYGLDSAMYLNAEDMHFLNHQNSLLNKNPFYSESSNETTMYCN